MPLRLKRYPERSPHWYIRGTVQGIRVFESTGESQKSRAAAVLETRQKEIFECRLYGEAHTLTFAEAAIEYMDGGGTPRFLAPIIERIGMTPLADINQSLADRTAHALYPGRKPATHARQVHTPIIAVLNKAAKNGLCGKPSIEKPRAPRQVAQVAGDGHINALLHHCSPRLKAMVLLLTFTGMRVSEACRLTADDFNLQEGWAICGRTKNGEPRMVPLPPQVIAAVANVIPDDGLALHYVSRDAVNKDLQRTAKRAGLPHMSSHKIGRHTFAARILAAGHGIKTLKEAGGWKSIRIVDETYGHLEQSHVHQVMLDVANSARTDYTQNAHQNVCSSDNVLQNAAKSNKKRKG